jgi:hypothetical protein
MGHELEDCRDDRGVVDVQLLLDVWVEEGPVRNSAIEMTWLGDTFDADFLRQIHVVLNPGIEDDAVELHRAYVSNPLLDRVFTAGLHRGIWPEFHRRTFGYPSHLYPCQT